MSVLVGRKMACYVSEYNLIVVCQMRLSPARRTRPKLERCGYLDRVTCRRNDAPTIAHTGSVQAPATSSDKRDLRQRRSLFHWAQRCFCTLFAQREGPAKVPVHP